MDSEQAKVEKESKKSPAKKKPYQKPKLDEYGSIKEVTLNGSGSNADFFGQMM